MKPKRHHFKFERRFVEDVRAFRKRCTIRAKRKRLASPGDVAVFSYWSEAAYRSPSVPIGETILTNVTPINIEADAGHFGGIRIDYDGVTLTMPEADQLARDDGFTGLESFAEFFRARLPFSGHHYEWATQPTLTNEKDSQTLRTRPETGHHRCSEQPVGVSAEGIASHMPDRHPEAEMANGETPSGPGAHQGRN